MKHIFLMNQNLADVYDIDFFAKEIYAACHNLGYQDYVVMFGLTNEEMVEWTQKFSSDDYIVYVVGDDQEVNYVLNGMKQSKAKLGIIPVGKDNDFYRSLDEYKSDIITSNVMMINGIYALNNFNIGMNAEIYANMEKLRKFRLPTNMLYCLSYLYTYFKVKGQVMGINDFWEKNILLSVANGTYFGGGYAISPQASIHRAEVFIMTLNNDVPRIKISKFWLDVIRQEQIYNPYVTFYTSTEEIVIETKEQVIGQLDGILIQGKEFRIVPHVKNIEVVNNRRLIRELTKEN